MIDQIGSRIKQLRHAKRWSLTELANRAGVAKSYLSNVERNIQSNPSIQFLEKIASCLGVSLDLILHGEEQSHESHLDSEWMQLMKDAMSSGISKNQFKEFVEFQKWKLQADQEKK